MAQAENSGAAIAPASEPFSLRRRVQTGGAVIMSGFGAGQILRLLSNLILARLLAPEAFGLMAIAVSINIWSVMLTDIGITTSVIRSPNSEKPEFLRTAWTIQVLRNLLIWVIICAAAFAVHYLSSTSLIPPGSIFANSLLPWVMVGIGLQLPISGLTSINQSMAQRRLAMKRVVALEVGAQIFTMAFTIGFALTGLGVWSLVIGSVAGAAFRSAVSHVIFPGPQMALRFVREHFDEIFGFGKWLIIASFFGFVLNRGDQLLFGWMMESDQFSLYAVASIWIVAAMTVIQTVISRVFLPMFSEIIRERPEALGNTYQKLRLLVDGAVVIMALGAFFLAEPAFAYIYAENFDGVGYYVKLLSPVFLFLPYRLISVAALAAGDSKRFTAITAVSGLAMIIFTPIVFLILGERAAIIFFACVAAASLPIVWRLAGKMMTVDIVAESRMIVAALILAILLALTT